MNTAQITDALVSAPVNPEAVRAQLAAILASDAFARARRMQRFLEFVVEETLSGRACQLGEYGIAVAVFDRPTDFEPALDPIVRNDARRLRVKLTEYYAGAHAARVRIEIPKGGYVPRFRAAAHAMEAVAATRGARRLAVLPFEAMCGSREGVLCGRALSMSLTAGITNLEGVVALAHDACLGKSLRDVAEELQLSHAINGCLWKSGDRCIVIVNLIQAANGTQLWAKEYDVAAGDILTLQADIAAQVVREVKACLSLQTTPVRHLAIAA